MPQIVMIVLSKLYTCIVCTDLVTVRLLLNIYNRDEIAFNNAAAVLSLL